VCFAVLLKVGLACAGGFTQTTWLTQVKEKLVKLFLDLNNPNELKIANMPTQNFAESSLAWLAHSGQYITPTAVDLYLTGKDYYPIFSKLAESLTLGKSLNLAMPAIYSVVVPKQKQGSFSVNTYQQKVFKDLGISQLLKSSGVDKVLY
jgi:hypothetical protein